MFPADWTWGEQFLIACLIGWFYERKQAIRVSMRKRWTCRDWKTVQSSQKPSVKHPHEHRCEHATLSCWAQLHIYVDFAINVRCGLCLGRRACRSWNLQLNIFIGCVSLGGRRWLTALPWSPWRSAGSAMFYCDSRLLDFSLQITFLRLDSNVNLWVVAVWRRR